MFQRLDGKTSPDLTDSIYLYLFILYLRLRIRLSIEQIWLCTFNLKLIGQCFATSPIPTFKIVWLHNIIMASLLVIFSVCLNFTYVIIFDIFDASFIEVYYFFLQVLQFVMKLLALRGRYLHWGFAFFKYHNLWDHINFNFIF